MSTPITTIATIGNKEQFQTALCNVVRFTKNNALNSDKVSGTDFTAWKKISSHVQEWAYPVYEATQNLDPIDSALSALIENAIKPMLSDLGPIQLHDKDGTAHDVKIEITDDFKKSLANACAVFAGKMGKKETPALQFARSQLSNANSQLRKYEKTNGVNPEAIEELRKQVAKYTAEVDTLLATADESVPEPQPAGDATFRKQIEVLLGRTLTSQKAQTWEQYQAKKEEQRKQRRAKTAEKKASK